MEHKAHDDDPSTEEGHTITPDEKNIERLLALSTPDFEEALSAHPDSTWSLDDSAFNYLFRDFDWQHLECGTQRLGFSLAQWPRMMALIQRHTPTDDDAAKRHAELTSKLQNAERGLVALFAFASSAMINRTHMRQILDRAGQPIPDDLIRMILERNHWPYHTREELIQGGLPLIIANNSLMHKAQLSQGMLFTFMEHGPFIEHCLSDQYSGFLKLMPKHGLQDTAQIIWSCYWRTAYLQRVLGKEIASSISSRRYTPYPSHQGPEAHPMDIALSLIQFGKHDRSLRMSSINSYLISRTPDEMNCLANAVDQHTGEALPVPDTALRHLSPVSYWMQLIGPIVLVALLLTALFILLRALLLPVFLHTPVVVNILGYIATLIIASLCAVPAEHRWTWTGIHIFKAHVAGTVCAFLPVGYIGLILDAASIVPLTSVFLFDLMTISILGILFVSFLITSFSEQPRFLYFSNQHHSFFKPLTFLRDVWRHRFVNVYLNSPGRY